jgi:hypothetical protein
MSFEKESNEVKNRCFNILSKTGVSRDVCQYYAEASEFEYDLTNAVCRIRKELMTAESHHLDALLLAGVIQSMSKNFSAWRQTFDRLSSKQHIVPSLTIDYNQLGGVSCVKALCRLQTRQVQFSEDDNIAIVDSSQPNLLKVRTANGKEGLVGAVSCLLPSPDVCAKDVIQRLQIYLLMCWHECDRKAKACLIHCLTATTSELWTLWRSQMGNRTKFEERVGRRLKRIMSTTMSDGNSGAIDCNRLHKILSSLETELNTATGTDYAEIAEIVANLDKAVLYYQNFRRQWRLFRQNIRELSTGVKPMHLVFRWDPAIFNDPNKVYKYYEVKLTTEEQTITEETSSPSITVDQSTTGATTTTAPETAATKRVGGAEEDWVDLGGGTLETKTTTVVETTTTDEGSRGEGEQNESRGRRVVGAGETSDEQWTTDQY